MELLQSTIADIPDVRMLIDTPILDSRKKTLALTSIFESHVGELSLDFIRLVAGNRREEYLPGMARYFVRLYKEERGIQVATVISASAMDEGSAGKIRDIIKSAFKTEIELQHETREERDFTLHLVRINANGKEHEEDRGNGVEYHGGQP